MAQVPQLTTGSSGTRTQPVWPRCSVFLSPGRALLATRLATPFLFRVLSLSWFVEGLGGRRGSGWGPGQVLASLGKCGVVEALSVAGSLLVTLRMWDWEPLLFGFDLSCDSRSVGKFLSACYF